MFLKSPITNAPVSARTHSLLGLTITTQERTAAHAMPNVSLLLLPILIAPQHAHGASLLKQDLLIHTPLPPLAVTSQHAQQRTAPFFVGPPRTAARTQRLSLFAGPLTPLPPPAVASQQRSKRSAFVLFRVPTLLLGRPFFLPTCSALRHASARTHGRQPTNERCDVRSAGVTD